MKGITARSIVAGFLLAILMAGINCYLTLKVGIIEEGTIITAMLFVGVLTALRQKNITSQEAALVATMGSAGGSFSFIANFFGASALLGNHLTTWQMLILPIGTSFLGLLMAIPLCRLYVVEEPLPWPTSKATITAIAAVTTAESKRQAMILFVLSALFGAYVFASGGMHWLPEEVTLTIWGLSPAARVGLACSPFIIGAGYLIGLRVGIGFLVGGLTLAVMSYYVPNHQPHKYIWPGVMFLVTSGVTTLLINWKTVIGALKSLIGSGNQEINEADQVLSPKMFKMVAVLASVFMVAILYVSFGVAVYLSIMMLFTGVVILNFIATRSAGETAFNPVRVMGVLLQGLSAMCGGTTPAIIMTGAGVAAGAIDQGALLTQDRVFGRHLGLTARQQWFAQLAVLIPIALVAAVVFNRVNAAYPLSLEGNSGLPAPVAKMWATMALVFSGKGTFPPFAKESMFIGGSLGVLLALADHVVGKQLKQRQHQPGILGLVPHSMGIGIGLIVPITYSFAFFVGAIVLCVALPKLFKTSEDTLNSTAAAGIFGEGLIGLVVAILVSFGILAG